MAWFHHFQLPTYISDKVINDHMSTSMGGFIYFILGWMNGTIWIPLLYLRIVNWLWETNFEKDIVEIIDFLAY